MDFRVTLRFLRRLRDLIVEPIRAELARIQLVERESWRAMLLAADRYSDTRCLTRRGYRCFSQNDEDGMIDEVFRRIGTSNRFFVEFGVETGVENNTLALLLAGWRGLWIEADPAFIDRLRVDFATALSTQQLTLVGDLVTAENIESLFAQAAIPNEPDLLSIDIDGNDFWVWKAISKVRPRVVVIEYNASLGRSARVVQEYSPRSRWDGTVAFGASLAALTDLAAEKGYSLVGCGLTGVNAFFVRNDCLDDRFLSPYTADQHYEPPRYGPGGAGHAPRWVDLRRL